MMLGVGLTLGVVAVLTVIAREWVVTLIARHGCSVENASRIPEAFTGAALVAIGVRELLS